MKLFKSLLVAPATLGFLAPMAATANEVTINDFNAAEEIAVTNSRVDGLEARLNNFEAGSFSETTTASFSVDAVLGAVDGAGTTFGAGSSTNNEVTSFDFQFNIGLSTSFTGEDSLDIAIDNGSATASTMGGKMGFDTGTSLVVDGVTYSFPVGGATMIVGDSTDLSAAFTGACTYSSFT
ncbi:porin, partial [Prochlorococcus sp. AH-736-A13]|nr:porin [Prochlorococcus sp. AH-736-A13]